MAGNRHLARRNAVQALYQWDLTEQPAGDIETHFIADHDFEGADLEYFKRLVRQVPLHRQEIEDNLKPFIDRELNSVDPVERAILRLGAYEIEYEKEIPLKVIIDEAVELAKTFAAEHGYRFINGVLDKLGNQMRPSNS